MSAFMNHFSFEFRTGIRNKELLLMNYLFPLGFYVMAGMFVTELNPAFRETVIPSMILFAIMVSMLLGLPQPLVTAREVGIFRSYKINGVPAISILTIPALTTMLHTLIVAVVITATAPLIFDAPLPVNWPGFIVVFLLTAFAFIGISLLISVISSSSRATVLWSQLIFLPSMMIGGLMIPAHMMPDALARIGMLLPSTYSMSAFQRLAQNWTIGFDPYWSLAVLLAGGVLSFGLAIYLFCWDSHNRTQRGHPMLALLALLPYALGALLLW